MMVWLYQNKWPPPPPRPLYLPPNMNICVQRTFYVTLTCGDTSKLLSRVFLQFWNNICNARYFAFDSDFGGWTHGLWYYMKWFKCACVCVCVCVCFQCLCLDIADVMEAFGKCSLVYNNSPFLLTIRRCRQIAVTQRCLCGNYQAITAECM